MDDFNAQIRKDGCREVAGTQTLHEKTNDNGEWLCNLSAKIWTLYKIHASENNQIDHVLIKKSVKSYRVTNID